MPLVVLSGKLPFTLTIDTDAGTVLEYLVDGYGYELDTENAEDRESDVPVTSRSLITKAVLIANEAEWPRMEEM